MGRRPKKKIYSEGDLVQDIYGGEKFFVLRQDKNVLYVKSIDRRGLTEIAVSDVEKLDSNTKQQYTRDNQRGTDND